jgi:hypothetical protein
MVRYEDSLDNNCWKFLGWGSGKHSLHEGIPRFTTLVSLLFFMLVIMFVRMRMAVGVTMVMTVAVPVFFG